MKKILLSLCLVFLVLEGQAQHLKKIVAEKYYVANATDAAADASGVLKAGSVTWRIYVELQPEWFLVNVFGVGAHPFGMSTTSTSFFNATGGASQPNFTAVNVKNGLNALDSWVAMGSPLKKASLNMGVLKSDDDNGTLLTGTLLKNNDASAGLPLTSVDGMVAVAAVPSGTFGANAVDPQFAPGTIDIFDPVLSDESSTGNSIIIDNGQWYTTTRTQGPKASNRILIAQITTDGDFDYKLNLSIGHDSAGLITSENFVNSTPVASDYPNPGDVIQWTVYYDKNYNLSRTLKPASASPTVNITAPTAGQAFNINDIISFTANAADNDGTVAKVEYYINGIKAKYYRSGAEVDTILTTAPYRNKWKSVGGAAAITAVATDFEGNQTTSAPVNITVGNISPTVSITSPLTNAHSITGDVVAISANAADADGTVTKVEFFVDGTSVGIDNTAPYTVNYTGVAGVHSITAVATDNGNSTTTSAAITLTVDTHSIPNISITAPATGTASFVGQTVAITANATGNEGSSITSVEFFVDGASVGTDNAAPYTVNYIGVLGTHLLTAKATDNLGAAATSASVSITVNNNLPTVNITAPLANDVSVKVGHVVAITATAADIDGTITSVEFRVNSTSIGSVTAAPYTINWTPAATGSISLTAVATDNNGGTTTSAIVTENVLPSGIHEITSSSSTFKVYPNPAEDAVTLDIVVSKSGKSISYRIITLDGQVIIHKAIGTITDKYQENINISTLPKGQYLVELSIDGNTISQRLLKQ